MTVMDGHSALRGVADRFGRAIRAGDNLAVGPAVALAVAAAAAVIVAVTIAWGAGKDPLALVRDPAAVEGRSPLTGFFSNIGVFALVATAAITLFTATITRRDQALLASIGTFSIYLVVDDFFMLHDKLLPGVGIPEKLATAAIGFAALAIFVVFRRVFLSRDALALWLAGALLAASVGTDAVTDYDPPMVIVEDTLKFAGIAVWTAFWITRSRAILTTRGAGAAG